MEIQNKYKIGVRRFKIKSLEIGCVDGLCNLKIKTKMLLGGGCLAAIPVLLGCYFLGQASISTGKASLEEDAKQSLIAIRDITATEITNYINNIEQQALSLSENLMVVDAMSGFRQAYKEYDAQLDNINLKEQEGSLESYYQKQFGDEYRKLNDEHSVD